MYYTRPGFYAYVFLIRCFVFQLFIQVELSNYLYESLRSVPNIRIYGPVPSQTVRRAALCSFNIEDIHPTDIATILDQQVCYKHKYGLPLLNFCELFIIPVAIDAVLGL